MSKASGGPSGQLRIVGGAWRRNVLPVAPVEGLRPTPDRVRETLFNWLGQDCTGWRVLDAFAGTGALGFEAASRGAAEVLFVEQNRKAIDFLNSNRSTLLGRWQGDWGPKPVLTVRQGEACATLAALKPAAPFDLIALDPPFGTDLLHRCLPALGSLAGPSTLFYIEWGESLAGFESDLASKAALHNIALLRQLKAGKVHAHLFGSATV